MKNRTSSIHGNRPEAMSSNRSMGLILLLLCLTAWFMPAAQAEEKIEADLAKGRYLTFEVVDGEGELKGKSLGQLTLVHADGTVDHTRTYPVDENDYDYMWRMRFDLDFKGGSMKELMLAVQNGYCRSLDQTPSELRKYEFVCDKSDLIFRVTEENGTSFQCPSITARAISLVDLEVILGDLLPEAGVSAIFSPLATNDSEEFINLTYAVSIDAETQTAVFSMSDMHVAANGPRHEAVVAAMEAAWQAAGKVAIAAKVTYHAPTDLLIVNGQAGEIKKAEQVCEALRSNGAKRETTLGDLKAELVELRKEISKLKAEQ